MNPRIAEILNDSIITEASLDERYAQSIDDTCDEVRIGSLRYCPSQVLREVDLTAYRCGFSDWLDAESDTYVEIGGNYYLREDLREALDALIEECDGEVEEFDKQIDDIREDEDADEDDIPNLIRERDEARALSKEASDFIKANL